MKKLITLLFICSFAYGGLDANLVLHYKMNDNDSNTAVIDSKAFSNGTLGNIEHSAIEANQIIVFGTLEPNLAGIYTITGYFNNKPLYSMPYDEWVNGEHYVGNYNIWCDGEFSWIIGDKEYHFLGWIRDNVNFKGPYTPALGKGAATATFPTISKDRHIEGKIKGAFQFDGATDYLNPNFTLADLAIFRNNFTLSCWIKTNTFSGSCLAGTFDETTIDFSSLFMAMGYCWDGVPTSWHHNIAVPDSYKDKWTMFTCSVEQSSPNQVTIKQYLNDTLYLTNVNNFILSRWAVQHVDGTLFTSAVSPFIGAYNNNGENVIEHMGYGVPCAFDNFMIFNKALNHNEVALLYNNGSGRENVFSDCNEVQSSNNGMLSDFNKDCRVDFLDLGQFALEWMICNDPRDIECKAD